MAFRTKKISQMDPKGANLASTDLLEISQLVSGSYVTKSITGAEIISGATTGFVPTTRTLTINGTTQDLSADRTFTISTGITIGTTAITSGTVGRVLFEGTGNVVSESANLFWDNTNGRLGIGTSSPTVAFDIVGAGKFSTTLEVTSTAGITMGGGAKSLSWTGSILEIGNSATWNDVRLYAGAVQKFSQTSSLTTISNTTINLSSATVQLAGVTSLAYSGADVRIGSVTAGFTSLSLYTAGTEKMRIAATTGNILINTTTDAGFKLDVNGTARLNTIPIGLGGGQVATNTTVGITALSANSSGSLNASFGYTALAFNTTGSSNTAIGFQSGYGNGTGSNNTSVGRNALITIGNYSDNTAVGAFADCVGFSGCTILGKSAVATANNQFVVGSTTTNAGAVTSEVNASTQVWNVIINGVARKILLA
jgi:hypothetical protein